MYERIVYPVMAAMTIVGVILGICDLEPSGPSFPRSKKRRRNRQDLPSEANAEALETEAHAW